MAKPNKTFSRFDTIGTAAAENDSFLNDCFVDTGYLSVIKNCSDPRIIVLGRTGSGKSALLKFIKENEDRVILINPEDLSLSYVNNSTILSFLMNLGVRFDLFFKMLWRHVLSVEILKAHFKLHSKESTQRWLFSFLQSEAKKRNKEAVEYLQKWGEKYWEETDYRVKEITDKFTAEVQGNLKLPVLDTSATAEYEREKKIEIAHRAQEVVNRIQISELRNIIDLVDDILDDSQKRYFILKRFYESN